MATQTEPTSPEPTLIEGLSIEGYAGIQAALAEGFPEPDVLALEGLDAPAWAPAKAGWLAALAGDGPNGPLFTAYRDKLAFAEDWLARKVSPIDNDASAWACFLGAFAASKDPMSALAGAGLRMSDLARLQRRWQERAAEDKDVAKTLSEWAAKKPTTMPAIKASAAALRPFPWSKKAASAAPGQDALANGAPSNQPDDLPLDLYAAVCAELAKAPSRSEEVLARHGLSRPALAEAEARYQALFASDPAIERDFRLLYAHHQTRLARSPGATGAQERSEPGQATPMLVRPKPVLASTSIGLVISIPADQALPFLAGEAPKEISTASASPPVKRLDFGGTSLAVEVPLGAALPFVVDLPPPAAEAKEPPDKKLEFGGTSLAVEVPLGAALPFVEGAAPKEVTTPSQYHPTKKLDFSTALAVEVPLGAALPFLDDKPPPAAEAKEPPAKKLEFGGTSLAVEVPLGAALPFVEGAAPKEVTTPSQYHPTKKLDFSTAMSFEVPLGAALPFLVDLPPPAKAPEVKPPVEAKPSAPAKAWAPDLTLEQHASLVVDLGMAPGREAEVLARYRLTPELKARVDQYYRERVTASPEAKAAWDKAYRAYYTWIMANRR